MLLLNTGPQGDFPGGNIPKFKIWHEQSSIFEAVAANDTGGSGMNLTGGNEPEQIQAMHANYLTDILRTVPGLRVSYGPQGEEVSSS